MGSSQNRAPPPPPPRPVQPIQPAQPPARPPQIPISSIPAPRTYNPPKLPPGIRAAAIARNQQEAYELDAADGVIDGKFFGAEIRIIPHGQEEEEEYHEEHVVYDEPHYRPSHGTHGRYGYGGEIVDIQYHRISSPATPVRYAAAPVTMAASPVTVTRAAVPITTATQPVYQVTSAAPQVVYQMAAAPTMTAGFPAPTFYGGGSPIVLR